MSQDYPQNWDLISLLPVPGTAEFTQELHALKVALEKLANEAEQLPQVSSEPEVVVEWKSFLSGYERWDARFGDIQSHLSCHLADDAENKTLQAIEGQLSALVPLRERISAALELALQIATESGLNDLIAADSFIGTLAYLLRLKRRAAAFRLPREQEQLATELAVDGLHAWGRLYDQLSGALRIRVMERGKVVEKSPGQVTFESPQRSLRENNYFAADIAWQTIADPCAAALNHIAGARLTQFRRLGRHHLDQPLQLNRMRRATLDTMWGVITRRKAELVPYLEWKAKLLGLEKLSWWDQLAPIPAGLGAAAEDTIPYQQGYDQISAAFDAFSPDLGDFARMSLRNRWIEAEDRGGKRQGAFCTTYPSLRQSRVFMTYTGTVDNMFTLAHELGHAYHSWVLRDVSPFLGDYPMNLAETASTFAEAVLAERRLAAAAQPAAQLAMLDGMLSDSVAFLMNIHARFLFEDRFYTQRANGELTTQQLSALMVEAQREAYLGTLADDGWNPRFWVSKLHFYISGLPFYNFPYTFGYLLSLGIFARGQHGGREFPEQYRAFLAATGSMDAEDCVQRSFGVDLAQPAFWNDCLDLVGKRVQQFVTAAKSLHGPVAS